MQFESIRDKIHIELNKYEIAIRDIIELGHTLKLSASTYGLDVDYLSVFIHTILNKGRVIKGRNKYLSFFDELAFLLYVKICRREHCICLARFKEFFHI